MRIISMLTAGVVFLFAGAAHADDAAESFVQAILDEAEPALTGDDEARKFEAIGELVDKYVDMRRVSRFVLGRYARKISAEQKEAYFPLFEKYATSIYQNTLSEYSGQVLKVTGSVDRTERDIIVNSKVDGAKPGDQFADLVVHWRVYRNRDGEMKIVDAGADNIWLALEQQSQFTSIIADNGGPPAGIDALIAKLKDQTGG